jgi:hypothetical protein
MLCAISLVLICLLYMAHLTSAQQYNSEDDLTFSYRERSADEQQYARAGSTKRGGQTGARKSTPAPRPPPPAPITPKHTTAAKLGSKLTSPLLTVNPVTPPFIYATETINQTHANMFKRWLDRKAFDLYELSMNYSGYKLLNSTYNTQLRKDGWKFAWINFTEMIIEISNTISEVLYNKTLVVKNLTDAVERAFDEYRNDTRKVKESAKFVYYDAKSPKTFCDVQEASNARKANQSAAAALLTTSSSTRVSRTTKSSKLGKNGTAAGGTDKGGGAKPVPAAAAAGGANAGATSVSQQPASPAPPPPSPAPRPPPPKTSASPVSSDYAAKPPPKGLHFHTNINLYNR